MNGINLWNINFLILSYFADVESTGSSNEFYDKFGIRYHISIILKGLWKRPIHRQALIMESRYWNVNFYNFYTTMFFEILYLIYKLKPWAKWWRILSNSRLRRNARVFKISMDSYYYYYDDVPSFGCLTCFDPQI